MHKNDLIEEVAKRTSGSAGDSLTKRDVEEVVGAVLEVITDELVAGGKVQLTGFGTWDSATRNPTNPQSGEKLGTRFVPTFKAGADLKKAVKARYVVQGS